MKDASLRDMSIRKANPSVSRSAYRIGQRLLAHLKKDGMSQTAAVIRKNLMALGRHYGNRLWDLRHGVDTSGVIQLRELTCAGDTASSIWYEPTPIRTLHQMARHLPSDLTDFTFVDFGSGKGRTILHASRLNFTRIIGVEFARELCETAN